MGQRMMGMMGRRQPRMQQPFQGGMQPDQGVAGGNMAWGGNGWTQPNSMQSPPNAYQYRPIAGTTWDPPESRGGFPPANPNVPAPIGGGPGMAGDIPLSELGRGAPSPLANMPAPGGGGLGMAGDIPFSELGMAPGRGLSSPIADMGGALGPVTPDGPSPLQLAQALRGGPMNPGLADMGQTGGNMWQPGMPTPGINPPRLMDVPRPNGRGVGLMPPGGWR